MTTTITFLTLLLGLTSGLQPVRLDVDGPAARVELYLDGAACGARELPPWRFTCDFGDELAPHELVAVARDADGGELARVRQTVNLAPRQAEAQLTLERDDDGLPTALRLHWQSVELTAPASWQVTFDGVPLAVTDPAAPIPLPDLTAAAPGGLHFATALVSFPEGTSAHADLAFGGQFGDAVSTRNTAVPLLLDGRHGVSVATAAGRLLAGGEAVAPVALEGGGADLLVVVEASAQEQLLTLGNAFQQAEGFRQRGAGMEPGDRFFLVDPTAVDPQAEHGGGDTYELFRTSPGRPASEGGLAWQLTHVYFPAARRQPPRLADAVAMAGMQAAAGNRLRAVVLVLGPDSRDASRYDTAAVRRFLARLRVPLHVWWLDAGGRGRSQAERRAVGERRAEAEIAWGGVQTVDSFSALVAASRRLRDEVSRQRILWIEGTYLPQQIAAAGHAGEPREDDGPGVSLLAGGTLAAPPPAPAATPATTLPGPQPAAGDPETLRTADTATPATAPRAVPVSLLGGPTLLPKGSSQDGSLQSFRDAVTVNLVNVDVVATDRRGRPVTDLSRDDFEVYEDGRRVELTHFAAAAAPEHTTGGPGAAAGADLPAAATPAATGEPLHLVLYLDDAHMRAEDRNRTLERLRPFLADGLPAGAEVLLLVRDTGLDLRQPFTADRAALLAALDAAGGTAGGDQQSRELRRAMAQVRRAGNIASALRAADQYASLRQVDARLTVRHLEGVVDSLAGLPGRKALLYVGDGLPMFAGRELYLAVDRLYEPGAGDESGTLHSLGYDLSRLYRDLTRRANAAGVTLYALEAAGLATPSSGGVEQREWTQVVGLDAEGRDNRTRSLHQLAAETGGLAITGRNAVAGELARLADDFGGAYSLAYVPPAGDSGELHRIDVRVHRPGVRLRHREAYLRRSPEQRMEDAVAAALDLSVTSNPFGLRLEAGPPQSDAGGGNVPLRLAVPFEHMVLVPSGSLYVSELQLFVAARPEGRTGASPVARAEVPVEIPAARAEAARGDYVLSLPLRLEPGRYRVAVGVRDVVTGLGGVVVTTVDVPESERARLLVARRTRATEAPVAGAELLIRSGSVAVGETYVPAGPFACGLVPTDDPLHGVDAPLWQLTGAGR